MPQFNSSDWQKKVSHIRRCCVVVLKVRRTAMSKQRHPKHFTGIPKAAN